MAECFAKWDMVGSTSQNMLYIRVDGMADRMNCRLRCRRYGMDVGNLVN